MTVTADAQKWAAALYTSPFDYVIDWQQLAKMRKAVDPLAQRDRCELLLRAVNGDALPVAVWKRFVGTQGMAIKAEFPDTPLLEQARLSLEEALTRIVDNPVTANRVIGANAADILNGLVITLPELKEVGGQWIHREWVVASSLGAALMYALTLLLDPSLPYGGLLRKCCLDECGRFAFGQAPETPGQPPNFFCRPDHGLRHARLRAAERSAAHRRGITVEQFRVVRARQTRKIVRKPK